jgi:hypothetical protein
MTNAYPSMQTMGRTALLLLVVFFVSSLAAQTEMQIMVNGPWDYVADPNPQNDPNPNGRSEKRVVVVAPTSTHHKDAQIFEGDKAFAFDAKPERSVGLYYLDIYNRVVPPADKRSAGPAPPTYPAQVSASRIKQVLYSRRKVRFAVSLPVPDYYSTYTGPYSLQGESLSESIMDSTHITVPDKKKDYTTWMVLHYWVSAEQAAKLTAILDDGIAFPAEDISFKSDSNPASVKGISIVMGAKDKNNDFQCDSYSSESFVRAMTLWRLSLYARFPAEKQVGIQNIRSLQLREQVS